MAKITRVELTRCAYLPSHYGYVAIARNNTRGKTYYDVGKESADRLLKTLGNKTIENIYITSSYTSVVWNLRNCTNNNDRILVV